MKLFALFLILALSACGESMDRQNRLKTYGSAKGLPHWPAESEELPLVQGTVAQGELQRERVLDVPPAVSLSLLERGHQRYDIYCAACHGLSGGGDGIIVARGFPGPKPFESPDQLKLPAKALVDAISNGYGKMYAFSDRVEPRDRWAIAVYIRALQLAARGKKT